MYSQTVHFPVDGPCVRGGTLGAALFSETIGEVCPVTVRTALPAKFANCAVACRHFGVGTDVSGVFNARMADEGRSPFSAPDDKTKVGQRIFDGRLSVYSDPWNPELPGPPVASGGIPAQKFCLVKDGVLENLVYNTNLKFYPL